MPFSSLGLSYYLLKSIAEQNFAHPYPIQKEAIPAILAGKDIFGLAKTGSGKTAAFVLPVLQRLQKTKVIESRHIRALVVVPTRELAIQISEVFHSFSTYLPHRLKTRAVYGGVSINPQMMQIQGTDILVATPGRLLDLTSSNAVHLSAVEILVLDEADKILHLGYKDEMEQIFNLLPPHPQTLLFSATLNDDINILKERNLSSPVRIEIAEVRNNIGLITQKAYHVAAERKGAFLRYLMKTREMTQVLIFVSSTHRADHVADKLIKNGIQAAALHSKKSQGARTDAMSKFKGGKIRALVATDLASRGIDIQFLPFVINYELPRSPTDYMHRIGRTGRAESPGEAISLISPEEQHHFKVIQKKMGKFIDMDNTEEVDLHGY